MTDCEKNRKLTPRQKSAVQLLALGKTQTEVNETLGLGVNTLTGWKRLPAFQEELERVQREIFADALGQALNGVADAVQCLRDICKDKKVSASARVAAAKALIEASGDRLALAPIMRDYERLLQGAKEGDTESIIRIERMVIDPPSTTATDFERN